MVEIAFAFIKELSPAKPASTIEINESNYWISCNLLPIFCNKPLKMILVF